MKRYNLVNNIVGWTAFLVAAVTYCLTIEPTASFWDCPEFITTGYKLEVGHPPGAPFFMLMANLFGQFASDVTQVARMVNTMNALLSAGTILFLFWSITYLVKKLVCPNGEEMTWGRILLIMGSGLVGSLVYTWSDTFWYSAVEGEVYAFSSLFTAVVFWLILKWESVADEPHSDRWLVLISYLMGLSIGVHLLNLLCIPAIVLVYYYKHTPDASLKGSLLALGVSAVLVAVVLYGIVPGVIKVGGVFELLFVNTLGMKFNTGLYVYLCLLTACLVCGIRESYVGKNRTKMNWLFLCSVTLLGIPFYGHGISSILIGVLVLALIAWYLFAKGKTGWKVSARTLNTSLLCLLLMLVGYASYALIVIRSSANTPMDQNSPEDIFTLGDYLGREQYGSRPLFYGQTYASKVALKEEDGACMYVRNEYEPIYQRKEKASKDEKDSYEIVRHKYEYEYAQKVLFPRMYSSEEGHINSYKTWCGGIQGKQVPYDECGKMVMVTIPTAWENLKFFFSYQLNFMYWRYFMWNFSGRQNDMQGQGEIEHGNWITGISFIDNALIGNQELLPTELKENKGHNVFYCLPLLLGLLGLFWQVYRGEKGVQQFWVVFFLFFMTGIAIVLYLNQTPDQPRERDYAYAGSFYAFAIWIGMGVAGLAEQLRKKCRESLAAIVAVAIGLLVPIQMVSQTWDDHDRSGRYTCADFGKNYLNTIPQDCGAIIYTNGDNDTFPLWYNQETEEYRTDVRVCNLSYLQTDWYIDQMKRVSYDSPAVPIDWSRLEYVSGTNEYVEVRPEAMKTINNYYAQAPDEAKAQFGDNPYELNNILEHWIRHPQKGLQMIPTDSIVLKIDKEAVKRSGMMIPSALNGEIPEYMHISLKGKGYLYKSELMMLEMLAKTNWERPLYMAITVGRENHLNLTGNFVQEGLAYRITPFAAESLGASLDTEKMYDNLMHKYRFGGLEKEGIYLDETVLRMCHTHRRLFVLLASKLIAEGKHKMAADALDYSLKVIPPTNVPHDYIASSSKEMADDYLKLGQTQKAEQILAELADKSIEYLCWYLSLDDGRVDLCYENIVHQLLILESVNKSLTLCAQHPGGKPEMGEFYNKKFEELYEAFNVRLGQE